MNYSEIAGLYKDHKDGLYIGNAEKAEEIYRAVQQVRSLGSTKNGIDKWLEEVYSILEIKENVEKYIVQCFMTIKLNPLRLEFDEEYAEMQFC